MENLKDRIKLIQTEYGVALHVKEDGKWHPIYKEVVKEVYEPKPKEEPKPKWWEFWK